jgi:hypothetical protein
MFVLHATITFVLTDATDQRFRLPGKKARDLHYVVLR